MAKCEVCGDWAGLFSKIHDACRERRRRESEAEAAIEKAKAETSQRIFAILKPAAESGITSDEVTTLIEPIATGDRAVIWRGISAWAEWMASPTEEHPCVTHAEETLLTSVLDHYQFESTELPNHSWDNIVRQCALRDIIEDKKVPDRMKISGSLPFNLEAGERIAWLFQPVEYLEDKIVRSSTRNYGGVSLRVAPGLYVHGGQSGPASRGEGFVSIDFGMLAVTDRALLFHGNHKALRVKYRDIASFTRYDYGVAFCKGNQTARNQGFETRDVSPGFPFLLVQSLAQLHADRPSTLRPRERTPRTEDV